MNEATSEGLQHLVSKASQLHPTQRLSLIRFHFKESWQRGEPVRVESYMQAFPDIDEQDAIDLIYQEIILREAKGEKPMLEEFLKRFPQWQESLRRQFLLHDALAEDSFFRDMPAFEDEEAGATISRLNTLSEKINDATVTSKPSSLPSIGLPEISGYRVEGILGKGGMGIVYKTWQSQPPRFVALKMVLGQADQEERRRFVLETEAVGRLQHPNIVQIFQVGEHAGNPFFSMEIVEGGSLHKKLGGIPWSPRNAAQFMQTVAQAMHHAHQRGIIHRDLKPGNILLTTEDQPKISDFGLAKRINEADQASPSGQHTISGAIVGTPSYMAPEQARAAKDLGPPADIYALGAILYEMLTGRAPFRGESLWETISQVIANDPVPPRRLQPKVPADLETITLKCLLKDPGRRYESAAAFAEDLGRFLAGEPILARPVSLVERTWMWAKRRPMVAGLLGSLLGVFLIAFVLVTSFWRKAEDRARAEKKANEALASANQELVRRENRLASLHYLDHIQQADRDLFVNKNLLQARAQLEACKPEWRGWEWDYLQRLSRGAGDPLPIAPLRYRCLHTEPGSPHLLLGTDDGMIIAWDLAKNEKAYTLKTPGPIIEMQPKGSDSLVVRTLRKEPGYQALTRFHPAQGTSEVILAKEKVFCLIGPDNNSWLAAREREIEGPLLALSKHKLPILKLALDPKGERLASVSGIVDQALVAVTIKAPSPTGPKDAPESSDQKPGEVFLWDVKDGKLLHRLDGHLAAVLDVAFSPDGSRLATAGWDQSVVVWDLEKASPLATLKRHRDIVTHVSFSPTGSNLVSLDGDQTLIVWNLDHQRKKYQEALQVKGAPAPVYAWNKEGTLFALAEVAGLKAGEIQLWQFPQARLVKSFLGHTDAITALAFDPHRPRLISAGQDLSVQTWNLEHDPLAPILAKDITDAELSPDGRWLLWGNEDGMLTLWDLAQQKVVWSKQGHAGTINAIVISGDGKLAVTSDRDFDRPGDVRVWDLQKGETIATLPKQPGVLLMALHPTKNLLALPGTKHQIILWDLAQNKIVRELPGHADSLVSFHFHGDDLVSCSLDGFIRRWNLEAGTLRQEERLDPRGIALASVFGKEIFIVGRSNETLAQGVDLQTLKPTANAFTEQRPISALAFGPEGNRLFIGTASGQLSIWDPRYQQYFASLKSQPPAAVRGILITPGGERVITLGAEGILRLRETKK